MAEKGTLVTKCHHNGQDIENLCMPQNRGGHRETMYAIEKHRHVMVDMDLKNRRGQNKGEVKCNTCISYSLLKA